MKKKRQVKKVDLFSCTKPCNNCPYRMDAPLRLWDVSEYVRLLEKEKEMLGGVYACHKANGSVCVGWLMKQDEQRFPSISLRIALSKHQVTREYLDKLSSPAPLYPTVLDMVKANYPEVKWERIQK